MAITGGSAREVPGVCCGERDGEDGASGERALLTNTNAQGTKSSRTLTLVTRLVGFGLDASVRRN